MSAKDWRKDIAEQILNNDAVMIIDKNKYQQLIGQNQQMQFNNKQILKFAFLLSFIFAIFMIIAIYILILFLSSTDSIINKKEIR